MNQVPKDVDGGCVHLLNPVNAIRGYDETMIAYLRKSAAIFTRKCDRQNLLIAGGLQGVDEIGRLSAGTESDDHIGWRTEEAKLVQKNASEIDIVTDRCHRGDVSHQWNDWKSRSLFDDRVIEFDA
jgi:hypothetical protein